MAIRKIAEIELKAGPYGRSEAVGSGFKFYSYDKDSAAIDLYFINQDGSPTDIMNCKTELMLLIKENDVQKKITVIDSEVEIVSALKGHARYVIPDKLRGYVGLVEGYVYLSFPDNSRTDECRFDFTIERSLIEEEFENGGGYYIKDIQTIFDEVKNALNSKIPEMQTEYDNLVKTFTDYANEKIAEYDSRFVTLNSNLLTLQNSLTTAQNKVTTLEQSITTANTNLNARIDEISKKIDDNDVFTKQESSANAAALIDARNLTNAWSWSADGTDRFTPVYPNENLLIIGKKPGEKLRITKIDAYFVDFKTGIKIEPDTTYTFQWQAENVSGNAYELISIGYANQYGILFKDISNAQISAGKVTMKTASVLPENGTHLGIRLNRASTIQSSVYDFWNLKIEKGNTPTIYTPAPSEDPLNAYPSYKGTRLADSENPADYVWQYTDEYVDYLIANNHVENLATPEEAKAGTDTTKTMTPATTAQSIDNRAVTLASNQTIGGIKNFKDGLMLNGTSVATDQYIEKTEVTTNTTDFAAESTVIFQRWGRMVVASVSITNKAANFVAWKTLMQFPDGYKPNRRTGWGGTLTNNTNRAPSLSVYANDSGISVMSPSSDFPASQNCVGTIVYFTSDAWPS